MTLTSPPPGPTELSGSQQFADDLWREVHGAVELRRDVFDVLVCCLLAEGHVLLEDYPGVGKTALARAIAKALGLRFGRVQCTSDLLPGEVVGTNVFNQAEGRFEFHPGPVFNNILLVDELNRASPKTQSGLLEGMQERRVTVERNTYELPRPFFVLATQNPIEFEGTYPLPEAQLDRFMAKLSLGYPTLDGEVSMLGGHGSGDRVESVRPVCGRGELEALIAQAAAVNAAEPLLRYVAQLAQVTRTSPQVEVGASPRAALMLLRAAKAKALLRGRDHVLPEDVQMLAYPVLGHRILTRPGVEPDAVVAQALQTVPAI